jgi:Flp pilus assembly pilin Flp
MSDTTANNRQNTRRRFSQRLAELTRDQRGASFIEYIIVVGLVAIIAIAAFQTFGEKVVTKLTEETQGLDKLQPSGH